jgi:hypothetical protein
MLDSLASDGFEEEVLGDDDTAAHESHDQARFFLDLARDAYSSSESFVDSYLRKQWEDGLRQWQSKHSTASKYSCDSTKGKSRLFRPRTRALIRKNEASAAEAFFATQDVVAISAKNDANKLDRLTAELAHGLTNHHLQNTIPWFQLVIGAYQSAQVNGSVVGYISWDIEKDQPVVELKPIENIRIDPGSDWLDPINTSPYLIDLIPMYIGDIRERMKMKNTKTGEPDWFEVSDAELLAASNEYYDSTRITREDRQDTKANYDSANRSFSIAWVRRNIVRIEGEDWLFYTLGGEHLLSQPKLLSEVYLAGERPYVMGCSIIEANRTYPSSVCDLTRNTQAELNNVTNDRRDNVKYAMSSRYFAQRGKQIDLRSLVRNTPGSVTLMNDPQNDVKVISTQDVTSNSFAEQDRINLDFDDLAGVFSGSSVQANRNLNETVGGMNLMSQSANQLGQYQLRTFVETFVEPLLKKLVNQIIRFETDPTILAIAGGQSEIFQTLPFDQVTDEMLHGNMTVNVNVGTGATNPQTQVERFFFGMKSLLEVTGEDMVQRLNFEEISKEVFGKLGYKDGDRFFTPSEGEPDPQIAELQQMVQQLQEALAQKWDPEEQSAKIDKLRAEAKRIASETVNKNVEAQFSAMSAAEKVAMLPQIAATGDQMLSSAGYVDQDGVPLQVPDQSIPFEPPALSTNPLTPQNPDVGMTAGFSDVAQ